MTSYSMNRVAAHATMTADEVAAWVSMARDGSLARYLCGDVGVTRRYMAHLRLRASNLLKAGLL